MKSFTFFLASAVEPLGVGRSRTFATTRNRIDDFDDTVFADLLSLVEELQRPEPSFDDALLRDLVRDRTGEIVSKKGTAFLVSEAHYRSMAETVYLIRSPANALRLLKGVAQASAGKGSERALIVE